FPAARLRSPRRECTEKRIEVDRLPTPRRRENDHDSFLSSRRACWSHGTGGVPPAAPTRSRFARYQSYVSIRASRFESRGCHPRTRCARETSTKESLCAVL